MALDKCRPFSGERRQYNWPIPIQAGPDAGQVSLWNDGVGGISSCGRLDTDEVNGPQGGGWNWDTIFVVTG
jgi:hypothetical protein